MRVAFFCLRKLLLLYSAEHVVAVWCGQCYCHVVRAMLLPCGAGNVTAVWCGQCYCRVVRAMLLPCGANSRGNLNASGIFLSAENTAEYLALCRNNVGARVF